MHISINTAEEISDLDRQVLALLAGQEFVLGETAEEPEPEEETAEEPEPEEEPAEEKPKANRRSRRREPEPEPEPEEEPEEEPEPMAEEPVEEEEDLIGEEEQSDEELLALAIKKATEMVGGGQAAQVREALDAAGASRVRELNADNVREFFKALS